MFSSRLGVGLRQSRRSPLAQTHARLHPRGKPEDLLDVLLGETALFLDDVTVARIAAEPQARGLCDLRSVGLPWASSLGTMASVTFVDLAMSDAGMRLGHAR
jgi:hypothetical protein